MAADSEQDKHLIKNLVPLNALSDEQLVQVFNRITISQVKNGTLLFREGDNDRRHVFLLQGHVRLLSGTREVDVIKSDGPNAKFALSNQLPRKFSGQAVGEVRFAHIDSDLLHGLVVHSTHAKTQNKEDDNADWMTLVLRARVLQQVPPANIQNVLRRMGEVPVTKDQVIVTQGDEADYFYIIARGTGKVIRKDPGGDRQLAVLAQGDSFGEDAIVGGGKRAASIVMASDGVLMRLAKQDFSDLIRRPMVQGIRMDKARPLIKQGAIWLDVRHHEEYAAGCLPGALNLPLENLRERYATFSQDKKYVIYGPPGDSAVATFLLRERGYDVLMLESWNPESVVTHDTDASTTSPTSTAAATAPAAPKVPTVPTAASAASQETDSLNVSSDPNVLKSALSKEAEQQLALYKNKLLQQVKDNHKLQTSLRRANEENQRLEEALQQALESQATAGDDVAPLKRRVEMLEKDLKNTRDTLEGVREELDMAQSLLNDASAAESTMSWEYARMQTRLEGTEKDLAEQNEMNRQLQAENAELKRRLGGK